MLISRLTFQNRTCGYRLTDRSNVYDVSLDFLSIPSILESRLPNLPLVESGSILATEDELSGKVSPISLDSNPVIENDIRVINAMLLFYDNPTTVMERARKKMYEAMLRERLNA